MLCHISFFFVSLILYQYHLWVLLSQCNDFKHLWIIAPLHILHSIWKEDAELYLFGQKNVGNWNRYCFSIRKTSNLRHNFFHHAGWTFQLKILAEWRNKTFIYQMVPKTIPKMYFISHTKPEYLQLEFITYNI